MELPSSPWINYVSAEMVAAGGLMALSIRSPIRFDARSSGSAVVQPNTFEPGAPTDSRPGLLEICARLVETGAANDERATARMRLQDLEGRAVQYNRLSPGL